MNSIVALPIAAAMPVAAPSIASGLPTQAEAALVHAAQDLAAIDRAFEDLCREHGYGANFLPLGVRRNENIATLITVPATSGLGFQAKASALRLDMMVADQDQHQQIAVSLADDLLGGPVSRETTGHAAASQMEDPVFEAIERHRKAFAEWGASLDELARLEKMQDCVDDSFTDAPCKAGHDTFMAVAGAAATTLPGLRAKTAYLQEIAQSKEAWMFDGFRHVAVRLVEGLAASLENISVMA